MLIFTSFVCSHCRACGNIFCNNCSSRTQVLPDIIQPNNVSSLTPARICDTCIGTVSCEYTQDLVLKVEKKTEMCALLQDHVK